MRIVTMDMYDPLVPAGDSMVERTFLSCRTSRMTINRVRRMLSETEIEAFGILKLRGIVTQKPPCP